MNKLTLGQTIEGIRKRDNKVLTLIYKELFPVISNYILKNGGTKDDAKDIFQETIIIIFKQIETRKIDIHGEFGGYLFGISRLVWLKLLRSREIHVRNIKNIEEPEASYNSADPIIEDEMEMRLFRKHFLLLGKDCQKVLQMSIEDISYDEIANVMGYKSEKIARNRKYKCKESLIKMIKDDPEYQKIMKDRET